jgi:hypothetical protein
MVQDVHFNENMKFSFKFLRNNIEESLFNKMLETYKLFSVQSLGGPLIAYLLLAKTLMTTESAIEVLIKKISKVKLQEIKGEDMDHVVSMICSTLDVIVKAHYGVVVEVRTNLT